MTDIVDIRNLSKGEGFAIIKTDGKTILLCETDRDYGEMFCGFVEESLNKFGYDLDDCANDGTIARLRDAYIEAFEKIMEVKFVTVFDEY